MSEICPANQPPPVVRSPSKLSRLLSSSSAPQKNLNIIEGDVKDPTAVAKTLLGRSIIISGVGGAPKFTPNPFRPTLDDPVICQSAARNIVSCLQEIQKSAGAEYKPPLLAVISTTGLGAKTPDLAWVLVPLYKLMLAIPHADKEAMEEAVVAAPPGLLEYVIVRPGLLMDGAAGQRTVRAGYNGRVQNGDERWGDVNGVVPGYTMGRADVGRFLFEEVVTREGGEWKGKKVSLVY